MKLMKRAAAALLAVCTALGCTSCGENTANAMNVDGYEVRAGIYLYYVNSAYNDAINVVEKGGQSFDDAKDIKAIKKIMDKADIDTIHADEWIKNKAEEYCTTFVAIEKEFDRLGLSLTGAQLASIDSQVATNMSFYGAFYEQTGIGEQSIKDIITNAYKQDAIWVAYYGEGGSEGVEESTLYDHYAENHFRLKYIEMPLKDGEGNLLKSDGKKEIEKMANDYMKRLNKKADDEAALMKEFDFLIDEHNNYVTSLSNAAVTTTDSDGNTITTETTAKLTTDKNGNTASTETTTAEDETETTTAPADTTTETTTTTTDTTAAEDVTDTTAAGTETTETTTTTEDTTLNIVTTYDKSKERVLAVSTSAKDDEDVDPDTTTEPSYTPCEKVYNWAVAEDTKYLKPELIKDDECWYIAVKMDIEDRMTDYDCWTDSTIEDVRNELYYDEFLEKIQDLADALPVTRNAKAFKRYKVLDVDITAYQAAMMNYYYSMYGLS